MPTDRAHRVDLDASPAPLGRAATEAWRHALEVPAASPEALHHDGRQSRRLLDRARADVAAALGAEPAEVSIHPSAADALATAMEGLAHARRRVGTTVVASAVERAVVLLRDPTVVPVDPVGRVDTAAYEAVVREPGVALAVLQAANGEVGTTQPVDRLLPVCRAAGVPLLVDASAGGLRGVLPTDWDALVLDAGDVGGPPLGLLAVRPTIRFGLPGPRRPAEQGRAWAPPWIPAATAAGAAVRASRLTVAEDAAVASGLLEQIRGAATAIAGVDVAGDPVDRLPHVVTFSALYADGESLVRELDGRGFALASGSACTASRLEPSHVLAAMGALTHGNVRVTLPMPSETPGLAADVARFCAELGPAIAAVRDRAGTADLL